MLLGYKMSISENYKGSLSTDTYIKGVSKFYSERADLNGDGLLTTEERLIAYERFRDDMLKFKRNYPTPRTFMIGLDIKF